MLKSRSRSSVSTAISASLTGEATPFVQLPGRPRTECSAIEPASRTAEARRSRSRTRSSSANGKPLHAHGRRIGCEPELQIVCGDERLEHIKEISGNRHFAHGVAAFAVFDPKAVRAATVVAGHVIHPHADEVGDVKSLGDVGHHGFRRIAAGREMQIAWPRPRRGGYGALGMAGGDKAEFAGGSAIKQPRCKHAVLHYGQRLGRDALGIERT